jgi:hypothetical protein
MVSTCRCVARFPPSDVMADFIGPLPSRVIKLMTPPIACDP